VIAGIAGDLMKRYKFSLAFPGLLFIDTPGHEVFMNLRKRGGSIADFAVLVVDAVKGFEPQTDEGVDILVERKTPFLVALNKIDRIAGWRSSPQETSPIPFTSSYATQAEDVKRRLDSVVYSTSASLARHGLSADLFSRVSDFSRTVAIVPVSALTGEGIPELLVLTAGLTQKYMGERLAARSRVGEKGRGVVLELKEERGLGTVLDVLLYQGEMRKGDLLLTQGMEGPLSGRARNLFVPAPLVDTRFQGGLVETEKVEAASGVRVMPEEALKSTVPGSPVIVVDESKGQEVISAALSELKEETSVAFVSDQSGIVVKADTFGTLEAVVSAMRKRGLPVRSASIGEVSKKDVVEASAVASRDPVHGMIAAFNVRVTPDAQAEAATKGISVVTASLIYQLLDQVLQEASRREQQARSAELSRLKRPVEIRLLPQYVFRRSSPVVVGMRVLGGTLYPQRSLIDSSGSKVGEVLQLQDRGKTLDHASEGDEVAMSLKTQFTLGRQIAEDAVLLGDMDEDEATKLWQKYKDELTEGEKRVLMDLVRVKRKSDPTWAMTIARVQTERVR